MEILKEAVRYAREVADIGCEKKSGNKKFICLNVVTEATKAEQFDIAKEYLDRIYIRKKRQTLCKEIVFDMHLFYSYILEYLCDEERNAEIKDKLREYFVYWFDELIKGNRNLIKGYNSLMDQAEMSYIWYKYFSDYNWEEVSPFDVIQSIRYGYGINVANKSFKNEV